MKRASSFPFVVVRWCGRQALVTLVVVVGAVVGWGVRKATGPRLASESVSARRPAAAGPRPAALGTIDPGGRVWLDEALKVSEPSAALLALRRQLAAGEISDFGRLARAMLTHPLSLFRQEALEVLLPAWGEKDPAGALQFALDYGDDLRASLPRDSQYRDAVREIGRSWLVDDPEEALRFITPAKAGRLWLDTGALFQAATSPGAPGTPGLVERLKLVASVHGEAGLSRHGGGIDLDAWAKVQRLPSADDWRALATDAVHPRLKKVYVDHALWAWRGAAGESARLAEARAWWGGPLPLEMEFQMALKESPENPALALELAHDGVGLAWFNPDQLANQARSEVDLQRWLDVLPDPGQRQELMTRWLRQTHSLQTAAELAAGVAKAEALGVEGEAVVADVLGKRTGALTQQVPEIFASLPPELQARARLEVVTHLGLGAPDVAAELWMDATQAELAQPGAAVVAEQLTLKLLARDAEVASAWIRQLPPGESRDRAVAAMIERVAGQDPETCADWAATIDFPAARDRALAALERAASTSLPR